MTKLCAIVILMMMVGCGFHPIYSSETQHSLPVRITAINTNEKGAGKLDFIMRQALERAFNPLDKSGDARYSISVSINKTASSFLTEHTSVNTRTRVGLEVSFIVMNDKGVKIIEDKIGASDSFEVPTSPYSAIVSEEETTVLLSKIVAQEIALRVASIIL